MAGIREGPLRDASAHSLAFRVMRLCRPALQVDLPLKYNPADVHYGEDNLRPPPLAPVPDEAFAGRAELKGSMDAFGVSGMLVLPQTFGSIYLGETFCSYISVGNYSSHDVSMVAVKAELQTERQRVLLADNTATPLPALRSGGRYDFIIEHDIKELGAHTLVCSAAYIDADGERKFLPQYFKFIASNPLSVRTKVRTVRDSTFLEACIENSTKSPLFLDQVKFEPSPNFSASTLDPDEDSSPASGPLGSHLQRIKLVKPGGGTQHFLYHLQRAGDSRTNSATNTLGKLEILWRTTLGEAGRLQTQQIMGSPSPKKEVELRILSLPPRIVLETPFLVQCRVTNNSERSVGPLQVAFGKDDAQQRTVVVNGPWALSLDQLAAQASKDFSLCLVALAPGVQKISGLGVLDVTENKPCDTLLPTDIYVESQ